MVWGHTSRGCARMETLVASFGCLQFDLFPRSRARPCLICPAFSPIACSAPLTFSLTTVFPCRSAWRVSSIMAASSASWFWYILSSTSDNEYSLSMFLTLPKKIMIAALLSVLGHSLMDDWSSPPLLCVQDKTRLTGRIARRPRWGCALAVSALCLKDVLTRLPTQRASAIDQLLPHQWAQGS